MASCSCDENEYGRNYYRYYDSPEGCDIPKKAMVAGRYGLIAGLILGTYDVLMYSHAVGFGRVIQRYFFHVAPLSLMGATFAVVSSTLVKLRERDDHLNYFLGGLACGPILSAYLGSKHGIVLGGILLGFGATAKKEALIHDACFFPKRPSHMNGVRDWRNDFTLTQDPRDDWYHTCGK